MIRITSDTGQGTDVHVTTADGTPIPGVTSIAIDRTTHADRIIATVQLHMGGMDVAAHPLLDMTTLEAAALHYGLQLTPIKSEAKRKAD